MHLISSFFRQRSETVRGELPFRTFFCGGSAAHRAVGIHGVDERAY